MGRAPCCDKATVKKGAWSPEEDTMLKSFIEQHGTGGNWIALPQKIGLRRCGKSCRLRWLNYLRPNLKHGGFSDEEDNFIYRMYIAIGSRWSLIASQLPGRTDNDVKNYWNTKLKKKFLGKQRKEQYSPLKQRKAMKEEADLAISGQQQPQPSHGGSNSFSIASPCKQRKAIKEEADLAIGGQQQQQSLGGSNSLAVPLPSMTSQQQIYDLVPPPLQECHGLGSDYGDYFSNELNEMLQFSSVKLEGTDSCYGLGGSMVNDGCSSYTMERLENMEEVISPFIYQNMMRVYDHGMHGLMPIQGADAPWHVTTS